MDLFERITRGSDEALLAKYGILGSDGRLTQEGQRTVLDLLFLGKNPSEIRLTLIKEAKKEESKK